ncbi:MAG: ergothioneine biosynthesis protein EgtB [Cyclobacteriaceae bacterium]|nr:ergothioneine biosynthesis protein EgtB [Cyclobacteriaceae bacterium]
MSEDLTTTLEVPAISEKYTSVRQHSEIQCEPLITEDYIPQPVFYISPPKWHLGHTTWFFEEFILKNHYDGYKIFDDDFAFIFNSYYNTVGDRVLRADRGNLTRPSVKKVYEYRKYVDEHMDHLLQNSDLEIAGLAELGLNHEQQHQELFLTDLKYILGHNPLFPVYRDGYDLTGHQNTEDGYLSISEGTYDIGYNGNGFCYDNELVRHKVFLHEFEINKSLVTNGEYIEFVNDNAYHRFDLWLDEGWAWVNKHKICSPMYWHKIDGHWSHYTLSGLKPLREDDILCHISYYEAAAFAEWKNMRLPTEFEWEAASKSLDWGKRWEWTGSAYLPYPGFSKPPGAVGEYNGKFMVNQMVMRGASSATSPDHSRISYRNFFHPHYQWQFTGIRLAKNHKL